MQAFDKLVLLFVHFYIVALVAGHGLQFKQLFLGRQHSLACGLT